MFTISGQMVRLRTVSSFKNLIPGVSALGMSPQADGGDGLQGLDETLVFRNSAIINRQHGDAVCAYRYLFPGRNAFASDDLHGNPAAPDHAMHLAFSRRRENLTEFTPIGSQSARD